MREEADLDALITRIQSDLRSGRRPSASKPVQRAVSSREIHVRAALREIRGRGGRRADVLHLAARFLAPVLIFAVVGILVVLFGHP